MPEGLSGTLILPRASCRRCAKETGKIEGNVLRTVLWAPRTHLRMKTKRPKQRPTKFAMQARVNGQDVTIDLPAEDYPTMLFMVKAGPPGLLVGRPREVASFEGAWIKPLNLIGKALNNYGIQSAASPVMDTLRYSQMLAKIAHSYAVAELGSDSFNALLPEFILNGSGWPYHLVGGEQNETPPSNALHELGLEYREGSDGRYLVAHIRLFANLGAPNYLVVVGEGSSA